MKKKLNNNIEIYNYLNVTNRKLGKLYKYTGTNCLPSNFDVNEETFKERILLNEMQNSDVFPPFVNEEKKVIKKRLKNSVKNIQKFKKHAKNSGDLQNFSLKFVQKLSLYLDLRHELSHALLKDFEDQDCDEVDIYRQIFNLDPVFGEFFDDLYDSKVDFSSLMDNLEERYKKSYLEKLQALEKKNEKRKKRAAQKDLDKENLKTAQKVAKQKEVVSAKKVEKTAKIAQKSKNLAEVKKVRGENKQKIGKAKEK